MLPRTKQSTGRRLTSLTGIGWRLAEKIVLHFSQELDQELDDDDIFCLLEASDPYRLLEVRGIGFKRADDIALLDFGYSRDHPKRHHHGNRAILSTRQPGGGKAEGVLRLWEFQRGRKALGLVDKALELTGVAFEQGRVWLPGELEAEKAISRWALQNLLGEPAVPVVDVSEVAARQKLNDEQAFAVSLALSVPGMVLTGEAGSGKTHTIASIVHAAERARKEVHVMAFAGKAARRAQQALNECGASATCSTIHKGLGLPVGREEPLSADIVVIDEMSMVPNWLLAEVIGALKPGAHLVLVGDPGQLPPIGYGTPFEDLIELGLPRAHLVQNYRQADQQSIFELGRSIRTRRAPELEPRQGLGFHFRLAHDDLAQTLLDEVVNLDAAGVALGEWQVVTWRNYEVHTFNRLIQAALNSQGEGIFDYPCWELKENGVIPRAEVRVGDKIIVTENDYRLGVMNGQTGVVTGVETVRSERCLVATIEGERVAIPVVEAEDLIRLGYCVTTHKAQGSGWPHIILAQPMRMPFNPNRFYYTAITRAQERFHLMTAMDRDEFWLNATEREHRPETTLMKRCRGIL